MFLGPSRTKLQFKDPEMIFFSKKEVPPLHMYTPFPKVAVISLRKMWGWALLSTLIPTFWLSLIMLFLASVLFLEPQISIPPFLFSDIRLNLRIGQHYSFCLDHVHSPYYLLAMRLFFMTFGQLLSTSMPNLHSRISLFKMLLLFPKILRIPVPEH